MNKIGIVYHSAHGHTEHIARHVQAGVQDIPAMQADLLQAAVVTQQPDTLVEYDGLILGSPTYLGGVSGVLKTMMDATGRLWRTQQLKGKLAAGFTVSSLPSGDKQTTLLSMLVFCLQHGMIWVGNPILPEQNPDTPSEEAVNRLGSWTGLMAQAGHGAPADHFPPGDLRTARLFGQNFAQVIQRMNPAATGACA